MTANDLNTLARLSTGQKATVAGREWTRANLWFFEATDASMDVPSLFWGRKALDPMNRRVTIGGIADTGDAVVNLAGNYAATVRYPLSCVTFI